jgi:hypothetical protein
MGEEKLKARLQKRIEVVPWAPDVPRLLSETEMEASSSMVFSGSAGHEHEVEKPKC